ncbi:uncharacterized protein F4822DRAFT_184562 [Hypoxylon trugodes]|uniref:uncharacterized protein n=1 Tax=Hypoxylon trugodes TaxID=326681 RepID=UPI002197423D|nr:uncharacterized protein F4822DRAFT_184562 [Hypoxylon trugodes]KAI1391392.1 hypothetical protein F4822DRAFT_184562 [Hypoxylon trugodes]
MATMRDDRTHPLLAQVPLTVSPFVSLPTAATLPYTYKAMPSTLPPPQSGVTGAHTSSSSSSTPSNDPSASDKPRYVIATSGHAAHPDDIISSCCALRAHLLRMEEDATRSLQDLEERTRARELAEKRRVAPGWLDSEARLLQPERRPSAAAEADADAETSEFAGHFAEMSISDTSYAHHPQHLWQGQHRGGVEVDGGSAGGNGSGTGSVVISEMAAVDEGEELDRAFGGWK